MRSFAVGLYFNGPNKVQVSNVVATGNADVGILVGGNLAKITSSTAAGNGHDGIAVFGDNNTIKSSTAVGNSVFGIFIEGGTSDKVQLSTASGNGSVGIWFEGNPAKLTENQVIGNGFGAGGASDLAGLGILVENFTIPPTGKNTALGNDDPAECNPANLC